MKIAPELFNELCIEHDIHPPEHEYRFHPSRKWRMDYAFVWARVFLEVQGALFTGGRHTRGAALLKEYEKINAATCLGWRPLFCTPQQVEDGSIFPVIREAIVYDAP